MILMLCYFLYKFPQPKTYFVIMIESRTLGKAVTSNFLGFLFFSAEKLAKFCNIQVLYSIFPFTEKG